MAAWGCTAEDTGNGTSSRPGAAVLRLLTAALAGGAVLLLWGGTAGARAADTDPAPSAAPTASSDGLVNGLLGEGGALTPVVELVDGVTQPLTGSTPVGTTVSTVAATVDPIVAPLAAPVAPVTDPVTTTVRDVTEGVTTTLTNPLPAPTVPGLPGTPTTPTVPPLVPPVTGPGGTPLPELPSLLPPDPAIGPRAIPGTGTTSTVEPSVPEPGGVLPLALAADSDGLAKSRAGFGAVAGDRSGRSAAAATAPAQANPLDDGLQPTDRDVDAGSHRGRSLGSPTAPVPCSGGSLSGPGSSPTSGPMWLVGGGRFGAAATARTISVPSVSRPVPAPCAGPEVSPD